MSSKFYETVIDGFGVHRRMGRSKDGTKWFGSITCVDPDTGIEEPMPIELPAEAVTVVDAEAERAA